ncbi:MAG: hypothetical protein OWQ54_01625 [Sulfolobaceae archaeon]|nr:hypothetical protein [Sulfolobaceae archaeon]
MIVGSVKDRTTEALLKYGEKARIILSACLEASEINENKELGDFSYKQLIEVLRGKNIDYDPKSLLRMLEEDYGIIQTTYRTSGQHWWKFVNKEQVVEALRGNSEIEEDPKISAIKIQAESLGLKEIEKKLLFLLRKPTLSDIDKRILRRFAFEDLPLLLKVYDEASSYEETIDIAEKIKKIIELAKRVSQKINANEQEVKKSVEMDEELYKPVYQHEEQS